VIDCFAEVDSIPTLVNAMRIEKMSAVTMVVVQNESGFVRLAQSPICHDMILISGREALDSSRKFELDGDVMHDYVPLVNESAER
jgi:hypothetical protein